MKTTAILAVVLAALTLPAFGKGAKAGHPAVWHRPPAMKSVWSAGTMKAPRSSGRAVRDSTMRFHFEKTQPYALRGDQHVSTNTSAYRLH